MEDWHKDIVKIIASMVVVFVVLMMLGYI